MLRVVGDRAVTVGDRLGVAVRAGEVDKDDRRIVYMLLVFWRKSVDTDGIGDTVAAVTGKAAGEPVLVPVCR